MLATQPIHATLGAAYIQEVQATLAATDRLTALSDMPWALLALNATFYLDHYLTTSAYRAALTAALQTAASERQSWPAQSPSSPTDLDELAALIAVGTPRTTLYRWLFERAAHTGQPARFLLAHHACEIAEVLAETYLPSALRLGLLPIPESALTAVGPATPTGAPHHPLSIELLSTALLRRRITPRHFAEQFLVLHATHRAYQLTGVAYMLPSRLPQPMSDAARTPICTPKRLRIGQPHDLARHALALADPLAVMTVEAGLVEAEELRGAPQLLLLAALDRVYGPRS
jgi:hypothetical protein